MSLRALVGEALAAVPRAQLATLPTPLESGPQLPGDAHLLVKRDDLSGLGLGGNKARKLELLCGAALAAGADTLVTVGAAQSNHARMTAAAGAVLGLDVHLVLGGVPEREPTGNQLLSRLFGAHLHHPGTDRWAELSCALDDVAERLEGEGRRPYAIPMGGSNATGALGFLSAWMELMEQCEAAGEAPVAVVHASSTGGTHGGLLAGRAVWASDGAPAPDILAIDVAKESPGLAADAKRLAGEALAELGLTGVEVSPTLVDVDQRWVGPAYAVPTEEGDEAVTWAGQRGALVVDRTYTGKALAGLLGAGEQERFGPGDTVVFWHTGGHPAVFTPGGSAPRRSTLLTKGMKELA